MDFPQFVADLHDRYGAEADAVRHEAFFIQHRRSRLGPRLRAALAALRDAAQCLRLPARPPTPVSVVAIASRAGSSGLEALRPFMDDLARRGIGCSLIVHPRLRSSVGASCPGRPSLQAWRHAWTAFGTAFVRPDGRAFVIRCCLFRLRLWQGAWSRALAGGGAGSLILHNDFELFCVAAMRAGGDRWSGICVQHGLPTDEFFPTRAQRQIVWGESSRRAYIAKGTPSEAIGFGPARRPSRRPSRTTPIAIRLVSQTHTPVFGRSLAQDFLMLAERLAKRSRHPSAFAVLLHPEEVRLGHPYTTATLAGLCRSPPHPEFESDPAASSILVGFCSTALLEAACRGHLVIGMNWSASASEAALSVGQPPVVADDADQLCDLLDRLARDPADHDRLLRLQDQWLARTFTPGTGWLEADPAWL